LSFILILTILISVIVLHSEELTTDDTFQSSTWLNKEGSYLYIDFVDGETHMLTGHYINNAEGYPCKGINYTLTGWIYGDVITFSVIWQNEEESCGALTTWIGIIEKNRITASWQLINQEMAGISDKIEGIDKFEMVKGEQN
jgi:avidin family protein